MRVLIVDDSKAMRLIIMRTLRQAGFSSHTYEEAGNGVEALKLIRAATPDLVLSDWNMPEMNGLELLKAIKAENLPVRLGFITAEGTVEMRRLALDEGALFLIAKPFTVESFTDALSKILT